MYMSLFVTRRYEWLLKNVFFLSIHLLYWYVKTGIPLKRHKNENKNVFIKEKTQSIACLFIKLVLPSFIWSRSLHLNWHLIVDDYRTLSVHATVDLLTLMFTRKYHLDKIYFFTRWTIMIMHQSQLSDNIRG